MPDLCYLGSMEYYVEFIYIGSDGPSDIVGPFSYEDDAIMWGTQNRPVLAVINYWPAAHLEPGDTIIAPADWDLTPDPR